MNLFCGGKVAGKWKFMLSELEKLEGKNAHFT
jgi:hypothetical protein